METSFTLDADPITDQQQSLEPNNFQHNYR